MKPFWVFVFFCFLFFGNLEANTFHFKQKEIGSPYYKLITDLEFQASNEEISQVVIEFIDSSGIGLKEKWVKRFTGIDYNQCNSFPCRIPMFRLPLSLEKSTCSINISTNLSSVSSVLPWGECKKLPPKPSDIFLPDLLLSDEQNFGTLTIANDGASLISRQLSFLSYIEDKAGKIIWTDLQSKELTLGPQEIMSLGFQNKVANWQQHLGCKMYVSLDVYFDIHEKKKKNNDLIFEFGGCEDEPDVELGARLDFEPIGTLNDQELSVRVVNHGRLPMILESDVLQTRVTYTKSDGSFFERDLETKSPFYGFDEEKNLLRETIPANTCVIEIKTNSNQYLKESNYLNNYKTISLCNSKE